MADIPGYTAFVAGTEAEHSQEILAELGPSTTRIDSAISWKTTGIKAPVLDFMATRMLRRYGALYDKRVAEMLQESARASV